MSALSARDPERELTREHPDLAAAPLPVLARSRSAVDPSPTAKVVSSEQNRLVGVTNFGPFVPMSECLDTADPGPPASRRRRRDVLWQTCQA